MKENYQTSITLTKEEKHKLDILRSRGVSIISIFREGLEQHGDGKPKSRNQIAAEVLNNGFKTDVFKGDK